MASTVGRLRLTAAEQFWYVLQCIAFGAGYFAKVPVKKALSELTQHSGPGHVGPRPGQTPPYQIDQTPPGVPPAQAQYLPPGRHGARHGYPDR
jgi:hypothetical protein